MRCILVSRSEGSREYKPQYQESAFEGVVYPKYLGSRIFRGGDDAPQLRESRVRQQEFFPWPAESHRPAECADTHMNYNGRYHMIQLIGKYNSEKSRHLLAAKDRMCFRVVLGSAG